MKIGLYALLTAGLLLLSGCSRDEDSHPEVQIYPVLSRVRDSISTGATASD